MARNIQLLLYEFVLQPSFIFTKDTSGDSTQLIFLRARWYNPADGRFQSRDTWEGSYNSPQSLNRWNYTQSNPVNYTDPSGLHTSYQDRLPDARDLTDWLPRAAVYMATDPEITKINSLNNFRSPTCDDLAEWLAKADAARRFYNIVKDGARFDVKDKIYNDLGKVIKLNRQWYEYSITGNILYGFYGMAAGYDKDTLHAGAGYAQLADFLRWLWKANHEGEDEPVTIDPGYGLDTRDDYYAIEFGVWLYQNKYKNDGNFTTGEFTSSFFTFAYTPFLAHREDPGDYIPNMHGVYAPNYFDH